MSQAIEVVIADDEPLLRAHLKMMIEETWPEADIVGLAANGEEALALIEAFAPTVVFLDIKMPGTDGLEVSRTLCDVSNPPYVVFVTAYDQHAVEAFENQAIDYLLKPIEKNRLERTIRRIKKLLLNQSPDLDQKAQFSALLSELQKNSQPTPTASYLKWLKASKSHETFVIDIEDVDYFIADNKYTEISAGEQKYLIKTPIATLENELDPDAFWRIHRNCMVRVEQIQRVIKDELGHVVVELKNSTDTLLVSRKYHRLFKQM
ncbi:DNA-binding response regulator [Aliidiomarina minuta]|uniref:DNA-binding response regulator n=1 Tax=Aliidiomarina minuta TaxID=880057 RepID=A0A432WA13_9GAMM|nr:LytTR family DNA-binding domain-containing protein [Aliidiomarina minuta]RUO26881.1 DNA-binding response regulator [Aliidiomarina minuta]